jgi:transposase InsO family protein
MKMEEVWLVNRQRLRDCLRENSRRAYRELAQETGGSLSWVKKWAPRLRHDLANDELLHRQRSPRHYPKPSRSLEVIQKILDIRDHPPAHLRRVPGPKAILYFLSQEESLVQSHLQIPKSTRTVWQVLNQYQRIQRPLKAKHEPLPPAAPLQHWQFDFKDVSSAQAPESNKRMHQVESLNVVDTGTSLVLDNQVRTDFTAETVILALTSTFLQCGLPQSLTFDRDPRFVGSQQSRDFPSALLRFLLCIGIQPIVCPPQRPDKNAYVERFHRSLTMEVLQRERPANVEETRQCIERYRDHYNHERPNQARSCQNQPPSTAFPDLPVLPRLPEQVEPDRWLDSIDGKIYQRRIGPNGTVKVDKYRYYIQQKLRGQLVLLKVDAPQKRFEIFFQGQQLKRMPIRGLHRETVSLQDYLRQICEEAVSEERQRLNLKQYWSTN